MAERAQRAANRKKRLQIKKSTSSIWQRTRCKYSQHNQIKNGFPFNTRVRCQIDEDVFLICWCFFYFHVFSEVAARWALSATVYMYKETDFCVNVSFNFSPELLRKWYNLQWYWIWNMHSFAPQTQFQTHFFNNCHLSLSRVDTSCSPCS